MKKLVLECMFFLIIISSSAYGQDRVVTGVVTAKDDGMPLIGVSVKAKGSSTGTATGSDGKFSLKIPGGTSALLFSFIGYQSQEMSIPQSNSLKIVMQADATQLSEVVVTGVGVATSRAKLGVAVESVSAKDLPAASTASIDQALVGKIAGAQITSANGSPGAPVNILLRGINTLNRGTSPMILLDGMEVKTDLASLDLNTIDRVEVVQGAASGSIYGAQGANGVIQIFTKKGKQGIQIDVSSNYSTNSLLNVGGVSKSQFHPFATNAGGEVIGSSGKPLVFDPALSSYSENVQVNLVSPTSYNEKPYDKNLKFYDHYKMFFQSAPTINNAVAISGANEKINYNFSMSDNRQKSLFIGNGDFARTNLVSNIGMQLAKNLTFRTITQLAYTKDTQKDLNGRTIFFALNNSRPFANYDYQSEDGNYGAYFGDATGVNGFNPNYMFQYTNALSNKIDLIQNFNLNYQFPKFLTLDAKYGLNVQNQNYRQEVLEQSDNLNAADQQYWAENYTPFSYNNFNSPATPENTGEINNYLFRTTFQNFLTSATIATDFQNDFKINLPIKTITQVSFDHRKNVNREYVTWGTDAPSYTPYTASQMTNFGIATDYTEPFITYGYVLNQRFEFGEIAGISGGIRSDYSSAFGAGSKPFTFPRGDAYLRVSQLGFWQNSDLASIMPELKFRAAYGEAGIQPRPFDRYSILNTQNLGTNNTFVFPTTNPNPNLNVEVSKELEIGTDIGFRGLNSNFLNDIRLSVTYWDRQTENAIYDVDAAPSSGSGKLKDNAFGLASNGIQASLGLRVLSTEKFSWGLTTNFSKQTSKITSVIGQPVVVLSAAGSSNYILTPGEKIGQLYGYLSLNSVTQQKPDGTPYIPVAQQALYTVASNGYVVNKLTKQPYFTPDKHTFGDPNPKFNMSFINDISYKGFATLSFQVDLVSGSHVYNQTKQWMYRDGIHSDYAKPITIDGETHAYTAFYRGVYAQRQANGTKDYFYENASFARLRNLSLAFELTKFMKLQQFRRVQLVLTGRNIATITNYTGYDPEVSSGASNSAFDRGVDHNTVPNVKTYQIGLNIGL